MYVYIYMMLNDHMMLPACQRQTEALGPLASELSTRRTPPFQVDARALPGLKGSGGEETTALEFMDARRTALLFWQRALSRGGGVRVSEVRVRRATATGWPPNHLRASPETSQPDYLQIQQPWVKTPEDGFLY